MPSGVVIFLSSDFPHNDKSYGMIKGEDGKEYIFYSSDMKMAVCRHFLLDFKIKKKGKICWI